MRCLRQISHVERVTESRPSNSWLTRIMPSISMRCVQKNIHVTRVNKSCHTNTYFARILSLMSMKWVQQMLLGAVVNESCHARGWAVSHIWINDSCHVYEWHMKKWVMSCIWISHVVRMNASCHACEQVMSLASYEWSIWTRYVVHLIHVIMSDSIPMWHAPYDVSHMWTSHATHIIYIGVFHEQHSRTWSFERGALTFEGCPYSSVARSSTYYKHKWVMSTNELWMSHEHIELPAKLLDYFLRRSKSNINQTRETSPSRVARSKKSSRDMPHIHRTPICMSISRATLVGLEHSNEAPLHLHKLVKSVRLESLARENLMWHASYI